eukprot:CAMPEP_0170581482 /NCGR_PEP_ID=MMETSP0224-20130122/7061_1 /TAXON_ID=285029 /ORGANISM="Togula jolla, Strain CCCM 725" /LENGTH=706 /DNA_ID=CAMNT_0010904617 /DNA_START=14 /DNA_END=2134 /DNA_ORIENTATION=-
MFAFGKHKGKSFEEVAESDVGYCKWVLGLEGPSGQLQAFADFVRANGVASGDGERAASRGRSLGSGRLGSQGEGTNFVCELLSAQEFQVRSEAAGGAAAFVPPNIWKAIGALKGARMSASRKEWLFPMSSYDNVVAELAGLGSVEEVPAWVLGFLRSAKLREHTLAKDRLPARLLPYQLEGVRFGLSRGGRCILGDEMGLGKSVQALSLAAQYTSEWPVLVVCPSTLRWVWQEQIQEWLPMLKPSEVQVVKKGTDVFNADAKFWIISYNLFAADCKAQKGRFQLRPDGTPHKVVIVDESHNIKEWGAERTKAVVPLVRKATRAMLLSGTPTRNAADELHPQLCAVVPGFSGKLADFRARYCIQQSTQIAGRTVNRVIGSRNASELNHLLTSVVMVRRLKKEVLAELPEKRRQKVPLDISDSKAMKDIKRDMEGMTGDFIGGGGGGTEALAALFQRTMNAKVPAVKEYLLEVLQRGDEKVIIFAHHKVMMDAISEMLTKQLAKDRLTHIRIDGGTPAQKRPGLVKTFQTDDSCRIALLSITACGEGLTLTAAGLVIFAELYWVPGAVEQAEARAHRIGTTHSKVVVEYLVVPGSPEERLYNTLERKKLETSHVLDGAAESLGAKEQRPVKPKRKLQPSLDDHVDSKRQAIETPPKGTQAKMKVKMQLQMQVEIETEENGGMTPSPVSRSKVEYLLRAARERQVLTKH